MQPAQTSIQLSLMPDLDPAPPVCLLELMPSSGTSEAITVLAGMIAQAAKPLIVGAGDE